MSACLLVRLRPEGPWRIGPPSGARDRVDTVFHSDTLYSALCSAAGRLGFLDQWLEATVRGQGAGQVRLSSLFPWLGEHNYVPAPQHLWPPASATRLRAHGARFIPAQVASALVRGEALDEDKWSVDGASECLVRSGQRGAQRGPFRVALRSNAAVDRVQQGKVAVHQTTCIEFADNAGLWCVAEFSGEEARQAWQARIEACFRFLGDAGLGGERSNGWGRSSLETVRAAALPGVLMGEAPHKEHSGENGEVAGPSAYWLLSLYSPAGSDTVAWDQGTYSLVSRGGRVESPHGWGLRNKPLKMVREGSVLVASSRPEGRALDVAPEGFPHPVYRNGHAVSLQLPWQVSV